MLNIFTNLTLQFYASFHPTTHIPTCGSTANDFIDNSTQYKCFSNRLFVFRCHYEGKSDASCCCFLISSYLVAIVGVLYRITFYFITLYIVCDKPMMFPVIDVYFSFSPLQHLRIVYFHNNGKARGFSQVCRKQ